MSRKFYPIITGLSLLFSTPIFSQTFSLLKDINPGTAGSIFFNFTRVGNTVFFRPDDGSHGDELWRTNGTSAGTVMVKDINPNSTGSDLQEFINVNGVLYFRANDGDHGSELWKSDGTAGGTVMVKDIQPGTNDGVVSSFFALDNTLYFQANDGENGFELWKSDGTAEGTVMVKDIYPGDMHGGSPQSSNPTNFTAVNNEVYFAASAGIDTHEIWKTDGTPAGTTLVKDIYSGIPGYALTNFIDFKNTLYFSVISGDANELWKSDGTAAGTVQVATMQAGNFSNHAAVMNNILYFLEADGLWKSDGTNAGTELLKAKGGSFVFSPELLTVINGSVYFTGNDDEHGLELWISDGTAEGTVLIKDIYEGSASSDINAFAKVGDKLMFTANNGINGNELWISDGTAAGTKMVQDIEPGSEGSMQSAFYELKNAIVEGTGKIFVGATTAASGYEVWTANALAGAPLPVELLEFKGSLSGNDGLLQWKTENENNTSNYVMERSIDALNYSSIATVLARNSAGVNQYTYPDPNIVSLGAPVVYYRLKLVDLDGTFKYSNIVAIPIENNKATIRLYPNPVTNNVINLTITTSQDEKFYWRFTDNIGRMIKAGAYSVSPGINYISEQIGFVSTGVYYMQLYNGNDLQQVIKVMKE